MKSTDILKSSLSTLLRPLSWIYNVTVLARNHCYDLGIFQAQKLEAPVISIGNLRMGGSGKTPLVEHLGHHFLRDGYRVAIVSRGYKRRSKGQVVVSTGQGPAATVDQAGDEPYMLSLLIPEAIIVVDADRVAAAQTAIQEYQANLILMDDGFQHRQLQRNNNVVVLPLDDVRTQARVVPAGPLRESWSALRRASHLLIVAGREERFGRRDIEGFLRRWSQAPIFWGEKSSVPVLENPAAKRQVNLGECESPPVCMGLAGIGEPDNFRTALEQLPMRLHSFRDFPDHYRYPRAVQEQILADLRAGGSQFLVMTAKDYVKWDEDLCRNNNVFFVRPRYTITPPLFPELLQDKGVV